MSDQKVVAWRPDVFHKDEPENFTSWNRGAPSKSDLEWAKRTNTPIEYAYTRSTLVPVLVEALKDALETMIMQEKRESGEFHIPQHTALKIWNESKDMISAAIKQAQESQE